MYFHTTNYNGNLWKMIRCRSLYGKWFNVEIKNGIYERSERGSQLLKNGIACMEWNNSDYGWNNSDNVYSLKLMEFNGVCTSMYQYDIMLKDRTHYISIYGVIK
eukprot:200814_1